MELEASGEEEAEESESDAEAKKNDTAPAKKQAPRKKGGAKAGKLRSPIAFGRYSRSIKSLVNAK